MKKCSYCNSEFTSNSRKQIFCSSVCRVKNHRRIKYCTGIIYCLKNPLDNYSIFYIGKTRNSLNSRLLAHLNFLTSDKKSDIIRSILANRHNLIIEVLEEILEEDIEKSSAMLNEKERFWIEFYANTGKLCNVNMNYYHPDLLSHSNNNGWRLFDNFNKEHEITPEILNMLLNELKKPKIEPKITPKVIDVKKAETIVKPAIKSIVEKPISTFEMPQKKKVDYRKEFESCELPDEFRLLWEKIDEDTSLTPNEKKLWKIEFGIK